MRQISSSWVQLAVSIFRQKQFVLICCAEPDTPHPLQFPRHQRKSIKDFSLNKKPLHQLMGRF